MIGPIKTVGVYVQDQAKALEFYTGKLKFELRRTLPMGPEAQWLEVAPPGGQSCLVLYPKAMMPGWEQFKTAVVFHCANVEITCRDLERAGVEITMAPKVMPWGTFATFADLDGNEFGLTSQELT